MIEEPPFRNRVARVLATLEARERRRKRALAGAAVVLGSIVVVSLVAIVYFTFVGDQHHVLEIQIGEATYRIESHQGPFTIEVPGRPAELPVAAGNGGFLTEHLRMREVVSRTYLWAPMAETSQLVRIKGRDAESRFSVNGIPFHATADRLQTQGTPDVAPRQWAAEEGQVVVIDVDRLRTRFR